MQCYALQILAALKYLHAHRVLHRDLKLGNLFLSAGMQVKLGDFGLATKLDFEGERKRTVCGTPNYIAPEIIDNTSTSNGHSYEVDIWSFGVIVYTLLIGRPPFETSDVKTTYKKIRNVEYQFPENVQVSEHAKSLIKSILVLEPTKRPKIEEIYDHPFFQPAPGTVIPKFMPASTLACPPSTTLLNQLQSALGLNNGGSSKNLGGTMSMSGRGLGGSS